MPELPEVETSVRGISPYLVGEIIEEIVIRQPQLRWYVSSELRTMNGAKIRNIYRRAKYLIFHTDSGDILVHLGMSGSLSILTNSFSQAAGKHDHIDLITQSGTILRYNDPRKFGAWLWVEDANTAPMLTKLGVEPLSEDFTADFLFQRCRGKLMAVKNVVMNNAIVVGVGNIYASESLFMAGIHPEFPAGKLTIEQCERLAAAIKQVLTQSISQGGTTLKDFIQPNGKPGYFAQVLQVYGRKNAPCFACSTPIQAKIIGQRNSFFCPKCQQLPC